MTNDRISKTYIKRYGGGDDGYDMWYEEDEITVFEGERCPECDNGIMKVSSKGNLYCSKICWEDK